MGPNPLQQGSELSLNQRPKSLRPPIDQPRSKALNLLPRKEVIQPHLPVQLPCYDFVPVTYPTLGVCLPKVSSTTSGVASFHDVTGGVYKPRERIHRGSADPRLLATPGSCRRVAACNPNWDRVWGIRSASRRGKPVVPAIVACV